MAEKWNESSEPAPTGKVTKTVHTPAPVNELGHRIDDPLRQGVAALKDAADRAQDLREFEIEKVRRSLRPVLIEAAALKKEFDDLNSMYFNRLDEIRTTAHRRDLRRWHRLDAAVTQLERSCNDAIQLIACGMRLLGDMPRRVKMLDAEQVATKKFLDFAREVAGLRDGPKRVRGVVEEAERILANVEEIVRTEKPTRNLIETVDPTREAPQRRQEKADDSWDPFPGTPQNFGKPEPFAL